MKEFGSRGAASLAYPYDLPLNMSDMFSHVSVFVCSCVYVCACVCVCVYVSYPEWFTFCINSFFLKTFGYDPEIGHSSTNHTPFSLFAMTEKVLTWKISQSTVWLSCPMFWLCTSQILSFCFCKRLCTLRTTGFFVSGAKHSYTVKKSLKSIHNVHIIACKNKAHFLFDDTCFPIVSRNPDVNYKHYWKHEIHSN